MSGPNRASPGHLAASVIHPTRLTPEQQRRLDGEVRAAERRMLRQVEALLARIPDQGLQQLTYELAFKPGPVLPKRRSRPQLAIVLVTEQVHRAHGGDPARRDLLVQLAVAAQEYYDILDDLVDGDVLPGHETEVVLVTQLIMPLMVQLLAELDGATGRGAGAYWSGRALEMVRSLALEKRQEKSLEAYEVSLEAQSWFYGYMTGLAALVEGAGDPGGARGAAPGAPAPLRRAEQVGREAYCYGQYLLDLSQNDTPDNWNLLHFMGRADAVAWMRGCQQRLEALLSAYPEEVAFVLGGLYSLDLEAFARIPG